MKILLEQVRSDRCSFLTFRCDGSMARTFCHQLQFSHETSDPFPSAMKRMSPAVLHGYVGSHRRIDCGFENDTDFVCKLGIFPAVLAGFAFAPSVCDPFPLNRLKKPREEGRALKGA